MKEFEKLWTYLGESGHESASMAIANCPDDWKRGHLVISTHDGDHHAFAHVFLSENEIERIITALQDVKNDMSLEIYFLNS